MNKAILLVTNSPLERWAALVHTVVERDGNTLTVLDPDAMARSLHNATYPPTTYDLALVDSSTIREAPRTVAALRSSAVAQTIIVVTAAPGWQQAREVFMAGAHDYQFKTYEVAELQNLLRSAKSLEPETGAAQAPEA